MDRRFYLIFPYFVWLTFFILAPFTLIFATAFATRNSIGDIQYSLSLKSFQQLFDPLYVSILSRTLFMAFLHSCITIVVAYPIAFFLSRTAKKEASLLISLFLVPFWTNYLIRILAFMDVLRLQPLGLDLTYSFSGIVSGLLYNCLPFAILPLYAAMEKIPTSIFEAGMDLGATKRKSFFTILWPLTKRATFATFLLVFIPSLGEFLIPDIIGGGKTFYLGSFLQQQFLVARNWPLGSAAILLLLLLSVLLLRKFAKILEEQ